jgi:predicted RNA-binding Zn-ribbon protein involved in translation (DUF1610 family)
MPRDAEGFCVGEVGTRRAAKGEELTMAEPVLAGSDVSAVSAGTYRCTECGQEIAVGSTQHLPRCPRCGNGSYETVTGSDSVRDQYPDR